MKKRHKIVLRLIVAALVLVGVIALIWSEAIDLKAAREWMQSLNPAMLIVLMAILPLFGFSVSVVYLVAGAAFGGVAGVAVVTGITAVHLLGSHWLGHYLRRPVEYVLRKRNIKVPAIPVGEEKSLSVVAVLTPGPPYFLRNYVLALSGIPLRTYFWIGWPIYVIRSFLVIFVGDLGSEMTWERGFILGGIFLLKVSICAFILYRMRNRYRASHPHQRPAPIAAAEA